MKASAIRYLIDAGPLVGALSARDQWHAWSVRVISTLDEPVFTTEIPRAKLVTLDRRDFGIYRRFQSDPLPLIHP